VSEDKALMTSYLAPRGASQRQHHCDIITPDIAENEFTMSFITRPPLVHVPCQFKTLFRFFFLLVVCY